MWVVRIQKWHGNHARDLVKIQWNHNCEVSARMPGLWSTRLIFQQGYQISMLLFSKKWWLICSVKFGGCILSQCLFLGLSWFLGVTSGSIYILLFILLSFLKNKLLEYSWFTMLCSFQVHSKVNPLYVYIHSLCFRFPYRSLQSVG